MATTPIEQDLRQKLANAPTYQKALRGEWHAPGLPNTPGFRVQNLRAAAAADGIQIPSGYAFTDGNFNNANEDNWYSDPRVIGPLAVGGAALGAGILGGPWASGQVGLSGTAAASDGLIPATFSSPAGMTVPVATQGAAGTGAALGGVTAGAGATSFLDKVKNAITDPSNIAGLAATIPAIASAAGGGNNGPMSDPTVQELLKMNLKRQQRTDPLHESVTQLSMAMLPTAYQRRG